MSSSKFDQFMSSLVGFVENKPKSSRIPIAGTYILDLDNLDVVATAWGGYSPDVIVFRFLLGKVEEQKSREVSEFLLRMNSDASRPFGWQWKLVLPAAALVISFDGNDAKKCAAQFDQAVTAVIPVRTRLKYLGAIVNP